MVKDIIAAPANDILSICRIIQKYHLFIAQL